MNDDTLTIALGRMTDAIEPPAAAEQLIATRRARVRRRRHLTTGLVAASVLAIAATGAAVASSMGGPGPNPAGPASAEASTVKDSAEDGAAPACPGGKRIWSLAELMSVSQEVPEAGTVLSMDLEGNPPRAWVLKPNSDDVVLELLLKKKGGQFVIDSAKRCSD